MCDPGSAGSNESAGYTLLYSAHRSDCTHNTTLRNDKTRGYKKKYERP